MGYHKIQGWEFTIHLYNAVELREFIKSWHYAVNLCREAAERNQHLIKFQSSLSTENMHDFSNYKKNKTPTRRTMLKGSAYTRRVGYKGKAIIISQN